MKTAAYQYLFGIGPTKLKVKAVICEASNLWMVTIIAHTDHWYSTTLDQLYQFLYATSILIACHAINFIHYQNMIFRWFLPCSTLYVKMETITVQIQNYKFLPSLIQ